MKARRSVSLSVPTMRGFAFVVVAQSFLGQCIPLAGCDISLELSIPNLLLVGVQPSLQFTKLGG